MDENCLACHGYLKGSSVIISDLCSTPYSAYFIFIQPYQITIKFLELILEANDILHPITHNTERYKYINDQSWGKDK